MNIGMMTSSIFHIMYPPLIRPCLSRTGQLQFAPFAALTGHGAAIKEIARLTEERIELDESCKMVIDGKLQIIKENLASRPAIMVTYFKPDMKKQGGAYVTRQGSVRKIDEYARLLIMTDGEKIPLEDIVGIEGEEENIEAK